MIRDKQPETYQTIARSPNGRALVVRPDRYGLFIREKGRRTGYTVDYEIIFERGAKIEADRRREQKSKRRGRAA